MVNYSCETCEFTTNRKSTMDYHMQSKKHQNNMQIFLQKQLKNNKENKEVVEFRCEYCHKKFKFKRYLKQHLDRCKVKKEQERKEKEDYYRKLHEKDKDLLEEKDKRLEDKEKIEKILVEGAKQMKKNNDKIYKMSMKNQDSYKFILEHFQEAPDIFFPKDIEEQLYLNMAKYMDMDNPVTAISRAFLDFIPKQPQEKRFIHGIDISRVKYVVKKDGKWNVDYYAKDVIPKFVYYFKKSCGRFVEGEMKKIEGPKIYDRIAFLDKLDSKILSNKVARNVSHDLQLNKGTYLRRMIELQKR